MTAATIISVSWWAILPLVLLGSLLHFVFDWTKHNRIAAVFGAVNESYWEHIKIAIWPVAVLQAALFAAGGYRIPGFLPAATIALYAIPVSMIGLVFLYKAITKRNHVWFDILVFAVVIVIAQAIFVLLLAELDAGVGTIVIAGCFLAGLLTAFLRFTLHPPREPDVFIDPLTGRYGLRGHPGLDES